MSDDDLIRRDCRFPNCQCAATPPHYCQAGPEFPTPIPAATPALDAAVMQRMAADLADRVSNSALARCDAAEERGELPSELDEGAAGTAGSIAAQIRRLPLPSPADRLAEALRLPEVKAAVIQSILDENGDVFDAMVEAAEWTATKDVSFNVVIGHALEAALRALTGEARHE
jgi:hypothetical protein